MFSHMTHYLEQTRDLSDLVRPRVLVVDTRSNEVPSPSEVASYSGRIHHLLCALLTQTSCLTIIIVFFIFGVKCFFHSRI